MSSTISQGQPPSEQRLLGNHEARIRALERRAQPRPLPSYRASLEVGDSGSGDLCSAVNLFEGAGAFDAGYPPSVSVTVPWTVAAGGICHVGGLWLGPGTGELFAARTVIQKIGSTDRAVYQGTPVGFAFRGAFVVLPLDTLVTGSALLDISNPINPVFVSAGSYVVTASVAMVL